jgi:hypothetical protein
MNHAITFLRFVLFLPKPLLSKQQALEIARAECEDRGWPWREPVLAQEHLRSYWFVTDWQFKGGNATIAVDYRSGKIVHAAFSPR